MKVQIIKARLNGKDLQSGEVYDIEDKLALRWIEKGNARFPGVKVSDSGSEGDELSKLSKKKLLSLAKEMTVDIPKNANKEDIIALIEKSTKVETSENETSGEGDEADEKAEKDKEEEKDEA